MPRVNGSCPVVGHPGRACGVMVSAVLVAVLRRDGWLRLGVRGSGCQVGEGVAQAEESAYGEGEHGRSSPLTGICGPAGRGARCLPAR